MDAATAMSRSLASFISMKLEITKIAFYSLSPRIIMTTMFPEAMSLPTSTIAATSTHPPPPAGDIEWFIKVLGLCFTALGVATQCLQYLQPSNQFTTVILPPTYYLFNSTLGVAFVALILDKFLPTDALGHFRSVLRKFGCFFAAVSFVAAITLIFPFWIKFTSWALFIITILISIIVSISPESPSFDMHLPSEADAHISPVDLPV